jgi:hypothetical protein
MALGAFAAQRRHEAHSEKDEKNQKSARVLPIALAACVALYATLHS